MQLLRFLLVSVANTALGLSCIYLAMGLLGLNYLVANAVGYAIGAVLGFALNRRWTFRHEGPWHQALWKWLLVIALSFGVNLLVVRLLHTRLGMNAYSAQLGGVICYGAVQFLGARNFAFRSRAYGTS